LLPEIATKSENDRFCKEESGAIKGKEKMIKKKYMFFL
jgi:hypothetical protein